ncbi:MAG TPA: alginate lyase family protein [Actinomycetota bacterium]|nr:alginate lyase family protein [Actinomycetota bacterium]
MRLGWYARRLASMSPAEMAGRARDELTRRRWRGRQVTDADADPAGTPVAFPAFAARLPVGGYDVPEDARVRLKEAAEGLLGGRWPVLGRERDDMAPAPDWFLDPTTGRRAPDRTYCFDIDYRDPAAVGDVKQVWEPSRHQHLTVLAAAYHVDGDERYAQAVATQLRSWWAANPFLSGIHWTSGIELGVRLLSWIWIRRLLDGWPGAKPLFESNRVFLQQLHHHQEWLIRLPSHGSSANNHLLAEMAGQFAAACAFPWFPESTAWRETAASTLERELASQTFACGLNRELATGYHGLVLELGLAAALEGELTGHPVGGQAWDSLRRMTDALAAVVDVRLRPPRQGDTDDGHGLLLDEPGYDRWASLLATGAALFGPAPWWPAAPWSDVRTALWTRLATRPLPGGARPECRPSLFRDAGMAILRDHDGRPDELWCRTDHGPHGYLSIAAHAHADALAIEFRAGGVDLLADPGTYCYAAEPNWRAYFRSTLAHTTLEVGGIDQSVAVGPHLWTRHAPAVLERAAGLDGGPAAEWQAAHYGYRRLRPPAVHRRSVRLDREARQLVIEDRLDTVGAHDCRLAFHLGPEVACALEDARAILAWRSDQGRRSATLALPDGLAWRQLEGRTDPPAGWYSPAFGVRVPSATLLGTGRVGRGQALVTVLQLDRGSTP